MLKLFWVIVFLVGVLWYKNTRYAIKQYFANRSYTLFTVYMGFLIGLGYLVILLTNRTMLLVQASQDVLNVSQNL
jgi:hypothetical protein